MIETHIKSLPLDTIDSSDHTYRISSMAGQAWIDTLAESIDRLGLLNAPLILDAKPHRRIVSGFRRVAACYRLNRKTIFCRILQPDIPPRTLAQIAVAENALQRPLDLMEKARAFVLLEQFYQDTKRLAMDASHLGLAENNAVIDKLIQLNSLPEPTRRAVENGTVGLAMALRLGALEVEEGRQVLALFETLQLGLNRQREFLELIREIAKRESITISDLLGSDEITTILITADQNRPACAGTLRQYLKKRRYPVLSKAESDFQEIRKNLGLGPRIRLNPPPFFEGNTFQLVLSFESLEELGRYQEQIETMRRDFRLKKFLEK